MDAGIIVPQIFGNASKIGPASRGLVHSYIPMTKGCADGRASNRDIGKELIMLK
jgi:hypothetical protein